MENRLLSCLTAPDLALLSPALKRVALKQGSVLHEPDSSIETVYFPLSGAVSFLAVMKGGEAVELASVGREGAVGLSAHSGFWRARSRAIVQVPGLAKAIPSHVLRTAIGKSEHIRDLMVRYMETFLAQSQQLAACNALHSVEERLARWLLQLSDRIGTAELPVTQELISQMLGVRRTTVTLVAQKLQHDGLLRYRRARITIVNPAALHALACECYEALTADRRGLPSTGLCRQGSA
jgi:CRP-like cAMP-binding protein